MCCKPARTQAATRAEMGELPKPLTRASWMRHFAVWAKAPGRLPSSTGERTIRLLIDLERVLLGVPVLVTVGFCDVTPTLPIPLGANGFPNEPWRRVADSLEVNAVVVHENPAPFVFVSMDTLFVGSAVRREVERGLQGVVPRERLWLSASHSHRAPAMDLGKPLLGVASTAYLEELSARIIRLIRELLQETPHEATVRAFSSQANHAINRRRKGRLRLSGDGLVWGGVAMGPNPGSRCDERVRRFDVVDSDGGRLASAWHYACHPTAAPDRLAVSAEFPGVVRARIRADCGRIPVLYFQGFSGDVRPPSIATYRESFFRRVRLGPHFRDFTPDEFANWSSSLADVVVRADQEIDTQVVSGSGRLINRRIEVPAEEFFIGADATASVTFHKVSLGPLRMVGVGAELVSAYQAILEASTGDSDVLGVGCLDGANGYLPTDDQLREGGYEAGGFCRLFALESVRPGVEASVRSAFDRLICE